LTIAPEQIILGLECSDKNITSICSAARSPDHHVMNELDEKNARRTTEPQVRFMLWIALVCLLLAATTLTVLGIVGHAPESARAFGYRHALGAQGPRKEAVIDGVHIAYADSGGSGPVLICLHAIGHGARDFEGLSRPLSPQYRVIALDFPNHGNSGMDPRPASATLYSEILTKFIASLELSKVTLLGNSIGGAAGIRYAAAHPERVDSLILCDTGGLGHPDLVSRIFINGFVQFFAAGRRGAFWFPWAFREYYGKVLIEEPAREERDRIVRSAYEIAPALEQAWASFGNPNENLLPLLDRIQCPVLLAWAKDDFVLPLNRNAPSFRSIKSYQLEIFKGGHAAFLEDPDRFEYALRNFLRTVPFHQSAQ
jgi:pimeloyl-ACP methyl ester carboxylesterase